MGAVALGMLGMQALMARRAAIIQYRVAASATVSRRREEPTVPHPIAECGADDALIRNITVLCLTAW